MMKLSSAAILFLFIACIEAKSASDFQTNSTSQDTALNHGKSQAQELLGRLYGSIKSKVKYEEKKNMERYELSTTIRKPHSGKGATGANGGSSDVNRRPRRSFAPSLLASPLFCASILTLYVSLALIFGLAIPFY